MPASHATSLSGANTSPTGRAAFEGDWRHYGPMPYSRAHLAGLSEFVRFGYHGTTIRRIAAAAEMSVPGLYYHFSSKQQILVAVLSEAMMDIVARRDAALAEAGDDPRARFVAQVENFCLHTMYRQDEALMARELRALEEPDRSRIIALRDDLEDVLFADVAQAADEGHFDVEDARTAGRAVLILCRAIAEWYRSDGPSSPEEITAQYRRLALHLVGDRSAFTDRRPSDPDPRVGGELLMKRGM
jgi:AcrR family transcriptional regulator